MKSGFPDAADDVKFWPAQRGLELRTSTCLKETLPPPSTFSAQHTAELLNYKTRHLDERRVFDSATTSANISQQFSTAKTRHSDERLVFDSATTGVLLESNKPTSLLIMGRHTDVTDEQCDRCCCSDFLNLPEPQVDPSWSFNLTNPILPLFAHNKLVRQEKGLLVPVPLAAYEKLAPALRLASRMLTDDRACHYICTMHDGSLHNESRDGEPALDWEEIDAAEAPWHAVNNPHPPKMQLTRRPQEPSPPPGAMRSRAREILESLAGVLAYIKFVDDDEQTPPAKTAQLLSAALLDSHARQKVPRTGAMAMLVRASFAQIYVDEPSSLSRYLFARVLVHEFGHVLNKACHGPRQHEVYYQDSWTTEAGFELENAIFSGTCEHWNAPDGPHNKSGSLIITEHWPSLRLFKQYEGKSQDFARRGEPDKYLSISRLDPAFLAQLCDDTFWNGRQELALSSSTLLTSMILPTNLYFWIVGVREDYVSVSYETIDDPGLPPELERSFFQTWQKKQERLASEALPDESTGVEDEETLPPPEEKVEEQRSPEQAGDWREQ